MFVFLRSVSKRLIHFLQEYQCIMILWDLSSMLKLLIFLRKSPDFLMCQLIIVPKKGDNILDKDFAMLWRADPIPEIIGRRGISGLRDLERP